MLTAEALLCQKLHQASYTVGAFGGEVYLSRLPVHNTLLTARPAQPRAQCDSAQYREVLSLPVNYIRSSPYVHLNGGADRPQRRRGHLGQRKRRWPLRRPPRAAPRGRNTRAAVLQCKLSSWSSLGGLLLCKDSKQQRKK